MENAGERERERDLGGMSVFRSYHDNTCDIMCLALGSGQLCVCVCPCVRVQSAHALTFMACKCVSCECVIFSVFSVKLKETVYESKFVIYRLFPLVPFSHPSFSNHFLAKTMLYKPNTAFNFIQQYLHLW